MLISWCLCRLEGLDYKVLQWYLCRMEGWFAADADTISLRGWDQVTLHSKKNNYLARVIFFRATC